MERKQAVMARDYRGAATETEQNPGLGMNFYDNGNPRYCHIAAVVDCKSRPCLLSFYVNELLSADV